MGTACVSDTSWLVDGMFPSLGLVPQSRAKIRTLWNRTVMGTFILWICVRCGVVLLHVGQPLQVWWHLTGGRGPCSHRWDKRWCNPKHKTHHWYFFPPLPFEICDFWTLLLSSLQACGRTVLAISIPVSPALRRSWPSPAASAYSSSNTSSNSTRPVVMAVHHADIFFSPRTFFLAEGLVGVVLLGSFQACAIYIPAAPMCRVTGPSPSHCSLGAGRGWPLGGGWLRPAPHW